MVKKTAMKKRAPRRRMNRLRRSPLMRKFLPGGHVREYASAKFTTTNQLLLPSQVSGGGVYAFRNFSLSGASNRVQLIAQAYQEYRIKKVTWQVKPFFDTFIAPSSATAPSVPHLYWRVDKLGSYNADTTLNTLKASGCKPIRLDDKMITKSFKPSVLQGVAQAATVTAGQPQLVLGSYRVSPWLPTNANVYTSGNTSWVASSIDHLGLLIAVDCDIIPFSSAASISFTVEFEFRKPLDDIDPSGTSVLNVIDLETLAPKPAPPPSEEVAKVQIS